MNPSLKRMRVGSVIPVALAAAVAGCESPPASLPPGARPAPTSPVAQAASPWAPAGWLVGTWRIDVGETAAVLARAQFGTQAVVIVKSGAPHAQTNLMHKPFDPDAYAQSKAVWEQGLARMEWQLRFHPNHSGEHVSRDSTNAATRSPFRWQVLDRELRIEYVLEKRFRHLTCRLVSSNELHYPMPPLGGYVVLRHTP